MDPPDSSPLYRLAVRFGIRGHPTTNYDRQVHCSRINAVRKLSQHFAGFDVFLALKLLKMMNFGPSTQNLIKIVKIGKKRLKREITR